MQKHRQYGGVQIHCDDAMDCYEYWKSPIAIIVDGPYGISGYPGDSPTHEGLAEWYRPHIQKWSKSSTPQTTLWFWNTEIGWTTVHPVLEAFGWKYRACHVWNKGISHIAGNVNTQSIRKLPVVTEVCVQYVKEAKFQVNGSEASMKEWLRSEWRRSGLPFAKTNEACGVLDAATRKYFTLSHLWYFPPPEAFEGIARYANTHGDPKGRPYFSIDGIRMMTKNEWSKMRTKFYCPHGITNVWDEPPVNGKERLRNGARALHLNQKPLRLMRLLIESSTDRGDIIWEPFGGLCSGMLAASDCGRIGFASEINEEVYKNACERFERHYANLKMDLTLTPAVQIRHLQPALTMS